MTRRGWKGLAVVGGFLTGMAVLLPVTGLLLTVVGLARSFDATGNADPATKSQVLADGIAGAMNATAFGIAGAIVAAILGVPALTVSLVKLARAPKE